jgi:hypothetical protein
VEEIWDGPNCYTYYVWGHSGFLFRQKKSQESYNRNKVEILVDDFDTNVYLPLEQMSGVADPSYENFNLKWKRKLGDDVYAIYDYSTKDGSVAAGTVIQCFGITQDALGRFVPDYRPVNLRKTIWKKTRYISRINKSGIGKILAFPESFEKIVPTPYFIKIISYDKILCLDYDFNTIFLYVREQGTTLTDCIMYEDKWIVTGSTTHNGYIGYDNYYVAVVDSNGDKLSESFLATKNAVITNIKETRSGEFVVSGKNHGDERIQISDDNTIVWLGNQNN